MKKVPGFVSGSKHVAMVAGQEFGNRFRTGWVLACALVWLAAVCLTSFYGLVQVGRVGLQGYDRTVVSLLNLVQYLVPLLGLLLGHDLIVGEREERTLACVLASGVSRRHLLLGKFLGGCMALVFPLLLGFTISGAVIGMATKDPAVRPFLVLALSGLSIGVVFLGIGLVLSTWSRTRVQALVIALLTWCAAVFAFDLLALGIVISTKAPAVAQEIETACDPTHLNAAADLHSAYDGSDEAHTPRAVGADGPSLRWVWANPVDLFRALNLSQQTGAAVSWLMAAGILGLWLATCLGASLAKFHRLDL